MDTVSPTRNARTACSGTSRMTAPSSVASFARPASRSSSSTFPTMRCSSLLDTGCCAGVGGATESMLSDGWADAAIAATARATPTSIEQSSIPARASVPSSEDTSRRFSDGRRRLPWQIRPTMNPEMCTPPAGQSSAVWEHFFKDPRPRSPHCRGLRARADSDSSRCVSNRANGATLRGG
jgi:hypothetical protein